MIQSISKNLHESGIRLFQAAVNIGSRFIRWKDIGKEILRKLKK